jgi:hypothetical protein
MVAVRDSATDVEEIGAEVLHAVCGLIEARDENGSVQRPDGQSILRNRALAFAWYAHVFCESAGVISRRARALGARDVLVSLDRLPGDEPDRGRTLALDLVRDLSLIPPLKALWDLRSNEGVPMRFGYVGQHRGSVAEAKTMDGPILADLIARFIGKAFETRVTSGLAQGSAIGTEARLAFSALDTGDHILSLRIRPLELA